VCDTGGGGIGESIAVRGGQYTYIDGGLISASHRGKEPKGSSGARGPPQETDWCGEGEKRDKEGTGESTNEEFTHAKSSRDSAPTKKNSRFEGTVPNPYGDCRGENRGPRTGRTSKTKSLLDGTRKCLSLPRQKLQPSWREEKK